MNEISFTKFLKNKQISNEKVNDYVKKIKDYEDFLKKKTLTIEKGTFENLITYTESLISDGKDIVLNFLVALMNYANFTETYEIATQIIDIYESYNAMDNLYSRVAEYHGEQIRDEIFSDLVIPPLGVNPEKKPDFTKKILNKIESRIGEKNTVELLSPCLHGRPPEDIESDKKLFKELGLDDFLANKREELIKGLKKHRDEGTLEFAQQIDDEVINFVKSNPTMGIGMRDGNIIYVSKIPYQIKKLINEKSKRLKRFYLCYCPWIRGALKNGTEKEIPKYFCNCSAGWYKLYWDQIFGESIKVEPVQTALNGALECKFAVYLPELVREGLID
ncbi:MAG: hypothetical protein ACFFKA_02640 [Candidatus Thorarchaeota archaeon]